MGVSQNWGYLFGGPHNQDYGILGSILGHLYFGKLPNKLDSSTSFVLLVHMTRN